MKCTIKGILMTILVPVCWAATSATTIAAASDNTYVSYRGADTNACTRVFPCRTITQALTVTNNSGNVHIIDTGEYSAFTINQNAAIIADPGVMASILRGTAACVQIDGGNVLLKNLQIAVCSIGFDGRDGIIINGGDVIIEDSTFSNNTYYDISSSANTLTVRRCHFNGGAADAIVTGKGHISVTDSQFNNYVIAIEAFAYDPASFLISHCVFTNNSADGVSGYLSTTGDNVFYGNKQDVSGSLTLYATK